MVTHLVYPLRPTSQIFSEGQENNSTLSLATHGYENVLPELQENGQRGFIAKVDLNLFIDPLNK